MRFEVIDTGIGIPKEHQGRLFQPFAQVDDSNSRPFGGTGLGLGICRQLVELMGGRIGMISEAGCGSTFWFELPFDLAEPSRADDGEGDVPLAGRTGGGLVLIADDNEINQEIAREMIQSLGYSCEMVLEGRSAVRAVTEGAYDLVMMDCMMPGIDGYEATRAIRRAEGLYREAGVIRRVPIVAMTANAMKGDRDTCLAAGMDDYVTKPLDPDEIARVLKQWVSPQARRAAGVGDTATVG